MVADVLSTPLLNVSWRRDLIGNKLVMWNNLISHLATVELSQEEEDEFLWKLDRSGVFFCKIALLRSNQSEYS